MAFSWSLLPSWAEGIYEIVSNIGHWIWGLIKKLGKFIIAIGSLLVALWQQVSTFAQAVWTHISTLFTLFNDYRTGMESAVAAGWPPAFANTIAYCNEIVPVQELLIAIVFLCSFWIVCTGIRIVKSCIPTISG